MLPLPVKIKTLYPKNTLLGADYAGIALCDDDVEYVLKDMSSHPTTPHNEWFCHCLAESVGLAVPQFCMVETGIGEFCFGSRWEGGLLPTNWATLLAAGHLKIAQFSGALSRIWAFDHFVFNDDRHKGNFIVRHQHHNMAMLAMDFSRAWLDKGFPPGPLPFTAADNTLLLIRALIKMFGNFIDNNEVNKILDAIANVDVKRIQDIISSHPQNWVTPQDVHDILSWWPTGRDPRLLMIRQGLCGGTYL